MSEYDLVVKTSNTQYPILFRDLKDIGDILEGSIKSRKLFIITDSNVKKLYLVDMVLALKKSGFDVSYAVMKAGEDSKTLETYKKLVEKALMNNVDRLSCIIALGGGVVGDTAGFVASTFMRGIEFVQVPTTLLAQVDSSVGGKVAVNLTGAKNIIGTFYQPKCVIMDAATLHTLPPSELSCGLAEIIKYGIICDDNLFEYLEKYMDKILSYDMDCLRHIIKRSCEIKAEIVGKDEKDEGYRAVLNYGHTMGHALEELTHYKKYKHGEALAVGISYEARLSLDKGLLSLDYYKRILALIKKANLPTLFDEFPVDDVIMKLKKDKKSVNGRIIFSLVDDHKKYIRTDISEEEIGKLLKYKIL